MTPILSVRNLSTGYGKKQVLFDVSLDVMPGEILLITGGNGSGKSTLLKAIYGMLSPWNAEGKIVFQPDPNGPNLNTQPPTLNLAKGLAYLPQKNAVFDDLTVEDNLRLAGHILRDRHEFAARRDEVLVLLSSLRPLLLRKPEKMSGGERQMIAMAMLLLLDLDCCYWMNRWRDLTEPILTCLRESSVKYTNSARWLSSSLSIELLNSPPWRIEPSVFALAQSQKIIPKKHGLAKALLHR